MIKFEHHWGGEDTWYTKAERWANKQKFPINHLTLGLIAWLKKHWIDGKIKMEMDSIDRQVKYMGDIWDKEDERRQPEIVETGVFGEEGWSITMSNPNISGGTEESISSLGTPSDEKRLYEKIPDPWYLSIGDPNDAEIGFYNEFRKTTGDVERR